MLKHIVFLGMILSAGVAMAQTTNHKHKDGTTVKVETSNGGSTKTGGPFGGGESTSQTHKAANKEVVKVGNDTGNPVVKSTPGGNVQK